MTMRDGIGLLPGRAATFVSHGPGRSTMSPRTAPSRRCSRHEQGDATPILQNDLKIFGDTFRDGRTGSHGTVNGVESARPNRVDRGQVAPGPECPDSPEQRSARDQRWSGAMASVGGYRGGVFQENGVSFAQLGAWT